MKPGFLLGAHMSILGGLSRALERGQSVSCATIQMFTRNASRWRPKALELQDVAAFKAVRKQTGISPVFAHCSYLINLAARGEFHGKSIRAMIDEVRRAERLGLEFVVFHPGAHMGAGAEEGLERTVDALHSILEATQGAACGIAIENTAGQGTCIGCSMEHLAFLIEQFRLQPRIGVCIDTCHLFASGYDIRTPKAYEDTMNRLLQHVPRNKILAFHLNDSKKPLGSKVDRHEHIDKGQIGKRAFGLLLNDPRFTRIPKVIETPKGNDLAEDRMNLNLLRSLAKRNVKSAEKERRGGHKGQRDCQ